MKKTSEEFSEKEAKARFEAALQGRNEHAAQTAEEKEGEENQTEEEARQVSRDTK